MPFTENENEELGVIVRLVARDPRWARMTLTPEQARTEAWAILHDKERVLRNYNAARYAFPRNALRVLEEELQRRMQTSAAYIDQSESDAELVSAAIGEVFRNQDNASTMLQSMLVEGEMLHEWMRRYRIGEDISDNAHYQRFRKYKMRLESECRDQHREAVRRMIERRSKNRGPQEHDAEQA